MSAETPWDDSVKKGGNRPRITPIRSKTDDPPIRHVVARQIHRVIAGVQLGRNRNVDGYRPDSAECRAWARKLRGSKIERSTRLGEHVRNCHAMGWSPGQIAGRMELDGVEHAVSVESIYCHVFSPAGRRYGLPKYLPQRKSRRGRRARNGKREPAIPNRVSIHQRPDAVEERIEFGLWEGDLMHFRCQRDILLTLQAARAIKQLTSVSILRSHG